jgi:hypothetical protein
MLDDLRDSASTFVEEEQSPTDLEAVPVHTRRRRNSSNSGSGEPFLGMTAPQRFTLALLMFLMIWVLGILFLVIMDKMVISIPGLF